MSTTAKAHGMEGTLVEPDWPALTLGEVRVLLSRFAEFGEPIRIVTCSPRPLSAASVVETSTGRIFIKRHHRSVRDREGLLEEHRFLNHLRAHGGPVAQVFADASGETAIEIGDWTYEVHSTPPGIDLYEEAISWTPFLFSGHAYSAGQALARMHLAARGFDAPRRQPRPLVAGFSIFAAADSALEMGRYLADRPVLANHARILRLCDEALELLAPFHAELQPLLPALPDLWTQNDLHASNLFWSGSGANAKATAIVDFGLADRANAVHDLAQAIERNIVGWLDLVQHPDRPQDVPVHFGHLQALLDGYVSIRPLSPAERAALAPMTALCHAEFALSEADYYLGVLHSDSMASLAYDGYLVGHARWFRNRRGWTLLDALRAWSGTHKRKTLELGKQ